MTATHTGPEAGLDTGLDTAIDAVELSRLLGLPHPPTPEQAAVIESGLDPAVVVAGAGSGKTETMAARVVWLIANRVVAPDAVLGLTFTRKAAAELSKRIRQRLAQWRRVVEREVGASPSADPALREHLAALLAGEPTVLTYAAYAGRLVTEYAVRLGAEPGARLISPAVAWQLADTVSRRHASLPDDIGAPSSVPQYVLSLAGQLADHLTSADEVERFCADTVAWFDTLPPGPRITSQYPGSTAGLVSALRHRQALVPLLRAFAAAKAALPAVDFADQMTVAAAVARLPEVQQSERGRYRAVLLDEYQDTGHAQVETLRALFGDGHPVTAVGDPFQSIYGWRGASSGTMHAFPAAFPQRDGEPAHVFHLATSFRNDRAVLDAANAVAGPLRTLGAAVSVELRAAGHAGAGTVAVTRTETVEDEATWVATRLRETWDAMPAGGRTAAVLVRRRSQIPLLADAVQSAGLPVEIVGLGGLLTTPEVADVVATLRVLVHHDAGTALARLLTGARWRIGPRDLAALNRRARLLSRPDPGTRAAAVQGDLFGAVPDDSSDDVPDDDVPPVPQLEPVGIVEALDDLGPADAYSAEGHRRLTALAEELRRLRARVAGPLPDLVADVERTIGVDVEVAARPDRRQVLRAHLDRLLDEAADFANEADEVTLTAFLAYLAAAEEEEHGLAAGEVVVESERVQVLTVHGAKGLEWDVVAVPGLADSIFPAEPRAIDWTKTRQELPIPLRGDRRDLPPLELRTAETRKDVRDLVDEHHHGLRERHALEERRLAYVAFTRARHVLLAATYAWDATQGERVPSAFVQELRPLAEVDGWFEADPAAVNPLIAEPRTSQWPLDPLGPYPGDRGAGRRASVAAGAGLVDAARRGELAVAAHPDGVAAEWHEDVDRLLRERAALARGGTVDVALPEQLSVSQLVELRADPDDLARRLHRPLPRPPAPLARRGTAFHTWLEQRWDHQSLLDIDELPGAADEGSDDTDFVELRDRFEASRWADRTPAHVEVPFEMALDGCVVRGRMDAVFRSDDPADDPAADGPGSWIVVDWKTGHRPSGAAAAAAAVQLAAYRLAWARLRGIPDDEIARVRAAFHYVRDDVTVEPSALLDADGLRALLRGA
ncbi:DNA helicase-2 / ATP-dependent DNA helicase PcrA [Jatrophihabitans endophyticus]|uniref:DNA 3'-5' helicase n=1 Tax=Jatrophihabitans endophyticus TaxID=1206085 RepID=A0A1M5ETL1_9ACTN|nr:UvrD-helicase domain-containing protein [Jatrophihabitans endophyticus]SHF82530.1 DNA helicase-2 / ATP-dependent DNA helicase PcrA [Jatrophihabitans endophyticus]